MQLSELVLEFKAFSYRTLPPIYPWKAKGAMGRAPCCEKGKVKKGPWSPDEDAILKSYVETHGIAGTWIALPTKAGLISCFSLHFYKN